MAINIRVAQKGFDAKFAADHQLLFSSGWPMLKLHASGSFTVNQADTAQTIYTHNLGYSPVFFVFSDYWFNQEKMLDSTGFKVDGTSLDYAPDGIGDTNSFTGYYYVFRHNLETNFTAESLSLTNQSRDVANDYRFKVARSGDSVESDDFRDLSYDSAGRSWTIHKQGYGTGPSPAFEYTIAHGLGYTPFFLVYFNINGTSGYRLLSAFSQDGYATADDTNVRFGAIVGSDTPYSYLIFKDPYDLNA